MNQLQQTLVSHAYLAAGWVNFNTIVLVGALVVFLVILVIFVVFANYFGLWIQSVLTKSDIGFSNLIAMTFRKVNARAIVRA
jgi:uncharacterized protein YqfA (UPF0365 family)